MDEGARLEVYARASLARRFEARVEQLAKSGEIPATLHMGAGQEVAQVAALAALREDDPMLYGHRGSAYWIARGVPLDVILCDIGYRDGGSNRGKGGPMHVVDPARGVLGETGTLGCSAASSGGTADANTLVWEVAVNHLPEPGPALKAFRGLAPSYESLLTSSRLLIAGREDAGLRKLSIRLATSQ